MRELDLSAEVRVAEPEPQIVVETDGDELRVAEFFQPRLWLAALIPLLFTAITTLAVSVHVADGLRWWPSGAAYEDVFFAPADVPLYARHLLPFGVPMQGELGYGFNYTYTLQSNPLLGVIALLIGILLAVAITRRSNDAIYLCAPYMVYSLIGAGVLSTGKLYYPSIGDSAGLLFLGAMLMPLVIGIAAKVVASALRNMGWLEIDQNVTQVEAIGEPVLSQPALQSQPNEGVTAEAAPTLELQHVSYAQCCPFCGNSAIQHDHPRSCKRCKRNIGMMLEGASGEHCRQCGGTLVTGAQFCHHCSVWLHAADSAEGMEVA